MEEENKRAKPRTRNLLNIKLKQLREDRKLSQREVGRAIGFNDNKMIAWYENTGAMPPFDKLVALAKFYNVSLDYLFGFNPNYTAPLTPEEIKKHLGIDTDCIDYLLKYVTSNDTNDKKRLATINKLIANPTLLDSISAIIDNTK